MQSRHDLLRNLAVDIEIGRQVLVRELPRLATAESIGRPITACHFKQMVEKSSERIDGIVAMGRASHRSLLLYEYDKSDRGDHYG